MRFIAAALAIAAMPGCYLAHEREAVSRCSADVHGGCARWIAAGEPTALTDEHVSVSLHAAAPLGCGAVAAWSRFGPRGELLAIETRAVDWDARPRGAVATLARDEPSPSIALELAAGAAGVAAFVATESTCRFVGLDGAGAPLGSLVALPGLGTCMASGPRDDGYAVVVGNELVAVGASGSVGARAPLDFPRTRTFWSRTTYDDDSFLAYSFAEDPTTTVYTGWLQHFAADGVPLHDEIETGVNGVPVLVSPTPSGAITVWTTATSGGLPMQMRTVDRDGTPTSPIVELPAEGAQYGAVLAPTGDGGALLVWLEWHFMEMPEWRLRALALGPDGAPRAEPTLLVSGTHAELGHVVVEPSGERAVIVYDDDVAVRARPLVCAD